MSTPAEIPLVGGKPVRMSGRDYYVPALTYGQVKRLKEAGTLDVLRAPNQHSEEEGWAASLTVCLMALQRNYPEMTMAELEDLVDLGNASTIIETVLGQSGFQKKLEDALGELMAGVSRQISTP
jgi:hypothetical protein